MGSTERLAYQASVIILFVIVVAVGVVSYMWFTEVKVARAERVEAQSAKTQAEEAKAKSDALALDLRLKIGLGEAATADEAKALFDKDMTESQLELSEQDKNYTTVLRKLKTSLENVENGQIAETIAKKDMQVQYDAREKASIGQIAVAKQAQEAANQQLVQEKQKAKAELDRVAAEKEAQKKTMQDEIAKLQEQVVKLEEEKNKLDGTLRSTEQRLGKTSTDLERFQGITSQPVDGEIVDANQRRRTVWINLGTDDGLPVPSTFSVYAPDVVDVTKDTPRKGVVEVVSVLQNHLAEARIVNDSYKNPILPGDKIATPIWHPGRPERFALGGFIDVNGDGQSDMAMLRNLVRLSGGQVDAYVDEQGKTTGEVSHGTRYLVVGEMAGEKVGADTSIKAISDATSDLRKAAKTTGTREISLADFLDLIGWTERNRVWNPTAGDEYKLRQGQPKTPPASTENVNEYFKKRRPPVPEGAGAY